MIKSVVGRILRVEYHLLRDDCAGGKPALQVQRGADDLYVWAFGWELIISRRRGAPQATEEETKDGRAGWYGTPGS